MLLTIGTHFPQILHGNGLAPSHVDRCRYRDVGDLLFPDALDQGFQLSHIHVPFEGMGVLGIVCFIDDNVDKGSSRQFLVKACCREIHIARDEIPRLDEDF